MVDRKQSAFNPKSYNDYVVAFKTKIRKVIYKLQSEYLFGRLELRAKPHAWAVVVIEGGREIPITAVYKHPHLLLRELEGLL